MRLGRIAAGFAQRAPLTQQGYQALDMGEYGWVLARFFHGIPRWMQRELARCPTLDPL